MSGEKLRPCWVCGLGRIGYAEALSLQRRLVQAVSEGRTGGALLILEHPPTITLGRFARRENILASPTLLAERSIEVHQSDRGGDVTFHCPGQLVIYAIMDLHNRDGMVRGYIASLEEVALRVLQDYGLAAQRWTEHPGLWLDGKQIAALGLHFSHGISMHGLALNVSPDLKSFEVINLCGLPGKMATSIAHEIGKNVSMEEAGCHMKDAFAEIFQVELNPVTRERLEGVCVEAEIPRVV